jgi:pimeloyl-ACP methyl ester carboxylesterase
LFDRNAVVVRQQKDEGAFRMRTSADAVDGAPTRSASARGACMMDGLFRSLLDDARSEIHRREPGYVRRFGLRFPSASAQARRYQRHPLFGGYAAPEIETALSDAIAYFHESEGSVCEEDSAGDPVALMLCDSVVDAFAASRGGLHLQPRGSFDPDTVRDDYEERRASSGVRYFIRRGGERALLLVNALGMPLSLWAALMGDRTIPWRLLIVESASTELPHGGMKRSADLGADAAAIAAALDDAQIDQADLVAWCSGGRIAIDSAARLPDRIRSLVLVSPTLRGAAGAEPNGTAFEDNVDRIFAAACEQPSLAPSFSEAFSQQFEFTAWDELAAYPDRRAATLFGLPARDHAADLVTPMMRPDHLINYGRRVLGDQHYPVHEAIARLQIPVMLLTGDYDNRVNNAFTIAVLQAWKRRFLHVRVKGAGHYLYDLQYHYFRAVLTAFLAGLPPVPSARLEVEQIVQ